MKTVKELYEEYKNNKHNYIGSLVTIEESSDYLVYNPTIPFIDNDKLIIGARVEKNNLSVVKFYEFCDGSYKILKDAPEFPLEDPFITFINNELIFGGVRLTFLSESDKKTFNYAYFQTVFYRGKSIKDLKEFARGPKMMKDIRLVELRDKRIGIFTRPSGVEYEARVQTLMGFTIIDNLTELNESVIESAKIIPNVFGNGDWGGPNQIQILSGTKLGIIGHVAYRDTDLSYDNRHYYGACFIFDYNDFSHTEPKIIIDRDSFPYSKEKELGLFDVVFTSGIKILYDNKCLLFTGLSDSRIGSVIIDNPFE